MKLKFILHGFLYYDLRITSTIPTVAFPWKLITSYDDEYNEHTIVMCSMRVDGRTINKHNWRNYILKRLK